MERQRKRSTYSQYLNKRLIRSMSDFLQALGGSNRKCIDVAMVTSTCNHRFILQKDGLLDKGSLSRNHERVRRRTLRKIIKIEAFCQVVNEYTGAISIETCIASVYRQ